MARPLRLSFEGAVYHITSRGNEKQNIFKSEKDKEHFLEILSNVINRYRLVLHAYCLMDNHYHLIVEVPDGNISKGLRQLNGTYTMFLNRKYERTGHLFQGRFKGILVEKNSHLLELSRYIVLNPVRAGICRGPGDYKWSSYNSTIGVVNKPDFLFVGWILAQFSEEKNKAIEKYKLFVREGFDKNPWKELVGQIYLGSEEFIKKHLKKNNQLEEIPRIQKIPIRPLLSEIIRKKEDIVIAHRDYGYTLKEISIYLDVHYTTAGRYLKELEGENA